MTGAEGCDLCRSGWYNNDRSPYLFKGTAPSIQSDFYRCRHCGTWWRDSPLGRPARVEEEYALEAIGGDTGMPDEDLASELEALIAAAPQDEAGRIHLMRVVLKSVLVLPSARSANTMSDVVPVMFPPAAHPSPSVFTTAEGAAKVAHAAPYQLTLAGFDLVVNLAPDQGLAVVGRQGVVVLEPELLASVRADLLQQGQRPDEKD